MNFFSNKIQNSIEKIVDNFLCKIFFGKLIVIFPSGKKIIYRGKVEGHTANICIHNFKFISKVFKKGSVGFAESYISKDFSTDNLTKLLMLAFQNEKYFLNNLQTKFLYNAFAKIKHYFNENTINQSKKNIKYHYDLGNDFYKKWLDKSMTYSSAFFQNEEEKLYEAQLNKYNKIAKILSLNENSHTLEIGCGWGGFSTYAAKKYKCKIDAITISKEQFNYASKKIHDEGLDEKVNIILKDYRNIDKRYKNIASIEMFEAVGKKYWGNFFNVIKKSLLINGIAAMQIITIDDKRASNYQFKPDFIQQYIFPGGMLPSKSQIYHATNDLGLQCTEAKSFGRSYAKTLNLWNKEFQNSWNDLSNMGFNSRFKRMWEYYLAYCETGFLSGSTDVSQFILQK